MFRGRDGIVDLGIVKRIVGWDIRVLCISFGFVISWVCGFGKGFFCVLVLFGGD